MSKESTVEAIEEKIEDTIESGVEKMIGAQEKMANMFDTAAKRNLRIGEEWVNAVSGTQQDFLGLYKNMAKEPRSYGKNMEAWMGSLTGVQKRTVDFAKVVYAEQSEAATEVKEAIEPFLASGKQFGESTKSWMSMWSKPFQANNA